jgi:hypothetical protein
VLQSIIAASSFLYGLLGKDQLNKAREVGFDFWAMNFRLKQLGLIPI